jgi:putative ABC transport system ATP-binding protein
VAIARAVAKNPKLLLCDEPTGALDYDTGRSILRLLQETCRNRKITVVVITHNPALMPMGDRVIKVKSGLIHEVIDNAETVSVDSLEW